MVTRKTGACLVAILSVFVPNAQTEDSPSVKALSALEKLGGWYDRDGQGPGGPVVRLDLLTKEINDTHLRYLKDLPTVRKLWLSPNISDQGLLELKCLKDLQMLYLSYSRITDNGFQALQQLSSIRELYVDNTQVTDVGLRALSGMRQLTKPWPA